ncbi:MAG: ATP-binding protein [Tepidisphaerales bacterium]
MVRGDVLWLVLTGGPGAGKTRAVSELRRRHGGRLETLPEAATQVYRQLGRRWDQLTVDERREAQRCMYQLQKAQEAELAGRITPGTLVLLDRGTLDGAGYWPDGVEAFFDAMGTTEADELARYDGVIHLQTASALGLYDRDASNEVRFETADEALASDRLMAALWARHPRRLDVPAAATWPDKLAAVERAVAQLAASAGFRWP